jgi:hypothetical protein
MIPEWMPRPIHTKEGKLVIARPHEATFNGRHNACKSKALIVLYHRKYKLHQATGLTLKELSQASGVSYSYLKSRLAKWVEWDYLHRKIGESNGGPVYFYTISKRGKHFIEDRIPRDILSRYIEDIKALRANTPRYILRNNLKRY